MGNELYYCFRERKDNGILGKKKLFFCAFTVRYVYLCMHSEEANVHIYLVGSATKLAFNIYNKTYCFVPTLCTYNDGRLLERQEEVRDRKKKGFSKSEFFPAPGHYFQSYRSVRGVQGVFPWITPVSFMLFEV